MQELGAQIRRAREAAALTQQQLADEVGVTRTMMSNYERGENTPDVQKATKLATALGAEFVVGGCRIGLNQTSSEAGTAPQQLRFDFDTNYTFPARVTIRPGKQELLITTVADIRRSA
jgi:transcriptional regulator with XRE-family HTH domain